MGFRSERFISTPRRVFAFNTKILQPRREDPKGAPRQEHCVLLAADGDYD